MRYFFHRNVLSRGFGFTWYPKIGVDIQLWAWNLTINFPLGKTERRRNATDTQRVSRAKQ